MTTSSSEALPARSPRPLTVTLAQCAPAASAAIVVPVKLENQAWRCSPQNAHEIAGLQRIQQADRIGDPHPVQSGVLRRQGELHQKRAVRPRCILSADGEKRECVAEFIRQLCQHSQHPIAVLPPGAQVQFRYRQREVSALHPATGGGLEISAPRTAPGGQPR
jgi:hypothetical protein